MASTKRVPLTTKFPVPEGTHTIVVLVPHYWGKGTTKAEAMANCKKEGGKPGQTGYIAYYFGEGISFAGVDMMGQVSWNYDTDEAMNEQRRPVKEDLL